VKVIDAPAKVCITDSMEKIIRIDSAVVTTINDELKLSGEISFSDNKVVKVYPFSSGKVMQVKVSLGDKVIKGQTLAIIKSADVAGNYSDISSSGNDLAIAKRQMENTASLFQNGIASEREYAEAKQNYQKAVNNAAKLQAQISINGGGHTSASGNYIVTAPASGYVVEKKINEGAFIRSDNADNMFTIGDISEVWVLANVYESDIAKVKEGYKVNVATLAYPGQVFPGVVDKISQILEPDTKVMKIRIRLANLNQKLKPQMFANVMVKNEEGQGVVAISSTAYISDYGKDYVVVYHDKCNLEARRITILKTVGDKTYLNSGLQPGEKIISNNQILLFKALTDAGNQ
jgi:cobalt-zinc-cadmium efflux system membrane fusion protein